jgi:D-beta-D-heptose 7-phosphate kinase/D-beta-D-heptose 1-phosphate adenosyltransferase
MESLIRKFLDLSHKQKYNIHCVGDAMVDEYYEVKVDRISPEHPMPVMLCQNEVCRKPGGSANVAYQFKHTNTDVQLVTLYDPNAIKIFYKEGINPSYLGIEAALPIKRRFMQKGVQVAPRLDIEYPNCKLTDIEIDEYFQLIKNFINKNEKPDAVIFSDYNKGFFNSNKNFIELYPNSITIVDPKSHDLRKWKNCTIFKPNAKEAEDLSGYKDWKMQCHYFAEKLDCQAVIITNAGQGIKGWFAGDLFEYAPEYDKLDVQSVIGAGDCFAAFLALALCVGLDPIAAAKIAYHAGLTYVKQRLNRPIVLAELIHNKIVQPQDLKNRDFNLVFTNGCFDILHSGHIETLKFARSKGDKLVVAINSDESVSRLKGLDRPIVPLVHRLTNISNLNCVDYVVVFDEDTPLETIKKIRPNSLVKGSQYNIDDVIGGEYVDNIFLSPMIENFSTTRIINKNKN